VAQISGVDVAFGPAPSLDTLAVVRPPVTTLPTSVGAFERRAVAGGGPSWGGAGQSRTMSGQRLGTRCAENQPPSLERILGLLRSGHCSRPGPSHEGCGALPGKRFAPALLPVTDRPSCGGVETRTAPVSSALSCGCFSSMLAGVVVGVHGSGALIPTPKKNIGSRVYPQASGTLSVQLSEGDKWRSFEQEKKRVGGLVLRTVRNRLSLSRKASSSRFCAAKYPDE